MKKLTPQQKGKKGGLSTKKKYGEDHFRKIGSKGGTATSKTTRLIRVPII